MLRLGSAVQIAYHVPDPAAAAAQFAERLGWGPFFYLEHIPLASCRYRGSPAVFDHSSAYGQAGDLMVELITQHDDSASVLRDLYPRESTGIHHVAHFVPSLEATLEQARAEGVEIALEARTMTGTEFAMLDLSSSLGHMVEVYEGRDELLKFYRYVRQASEGWDGSRALRRLKP
jgi:catechol 2,3-dioxygenase-like lactoylglutathione lyase family enzyme